MCRAIKNDEFSIICRTLKKERKTNRKLTLDGLSKISGYTAQAISQWENGTRSPGIKTLIDWANSLGYKLTITKIQD